MGVRTDLGTVGNDLWSNTHVFIRPLKTESDLIYAAYDCQLDDKQKELVNPDGILLVGHICSEKTIIPVSYTTNK